MNHGRVVVAMSGGVDSSVVAALLLEQGHDVIGATLQLRPCNDGNSTLKCCGGDGIAAARATASHLGIAHYVLSCHEAFEERVLRYSWDEYAQGRTPNPCVMCNLHLKWGVLLERARSLGADRIATGHYARVVMTDAGPALARGVDAQKDQSYFLFPLTPSHLAQTLFPLGAMTKPEVRELARRYALPTAEKPESQDVCFENPGEGFAESLRLRFGAYSLEGAFVDIHGHVLGRHEGVHHYTIGQRRGLGFGLGARAYVVALRPDRAEVVLSSNPVDLDVAGLRAADMAWQAGAPEAGEAFACEAQTRYRQRPVSARATVLADATTDVLFETPLRAVTPGQAVVLYRADRVLGGGWIKQGFPYIRA